MFHFVQLRQHLQYLYSLKNWIIDTSVNIDSNADLSDFEVAFKKVNKVLQCVNMHLKFCLEFFRLKLNTTV